MTSRDVPLASVFLGALPEGMRGDWDVSDELEELLAAQCASAEAAHPERFIPREKFVQALADRVGRGSVSIEEVFAADLYLCVACLEGSQEAQAKFDKRVLETFRRPLRRLLGAAEIDDLFQHLRISLFLPRSSKPAKAALYTGRVPVGGWLAVVIQRQALSMVRDASADRERIRAFQGFQAETQAPTPESLYAQEEQRPEFRAALERVVASLAAQERDVLTWLVRERTSVDVIAERLSVHRATAARIVARLRMRVLAGVRQELRKKLKLNDSSLDSLCSSIAVRFDVSLSGVLK